MKKLAVSFGLSAAIFSANALADVPAGYTGVPFKGVMATLPGRVDFENYDEGGQDVTWRVDDHTGNFGVGGCAANDYRTDMPHPQLCLTNNANEVDTYAAGPLMGQKYPSDAMPQSIYIGYTHGADWVKLTVNVTKAGTYRLSSTWASEPSGPDQIKFQVSFNDVVKADVSLPGTGGYHNWVAYPEFAKVDLDAGVQVLQFAPKSMHLNYDYLQFSLELPGGGVDDGSGSATGGSGGTGAGGGAGAGGTSSGAGGTMPSSGSGGMPGGTTGGGAGLPAVAGSGGATSAGTSGAGTSGTGGASAVTPVDMSSAVAGNAPAGSNAPAATQSPQQDSSCSVAFGRKQRAPYWLGLALAGLFVSGGLRRFSRSRRVARRSRDAA